MHKPSYVGGLRGRQQESTLSKHLRAAAIAKLLVKETGQIHIVVVFHHGGRDVNQLSAVSVKRR